MRIIALETLKDFWQSSGHQDSELPLRAWYHEAKSSTWHSPDIIKRRFRTASIINNNRIVFNIDGNKFRLVVSIHYELQIIFIRFIGTHQQYNKIDVTKI